MPSRNEVLEVLQRRFDPTELRELCVRLGLTDYRLSSGNHDDKALALLLHCERHERITELVQAIVTLRPALGWEVAPSLSDAPPITPPALSNPFYARSTELVGREEEMRRVWGKLKAGNHCSIVGPAGSGKSSLVEAVVADLPQSLGWRAEEVIVIPFRGIMNLSAIRDELVVKLGGSRPNQLASLLHQRRLRLLGLDDVGGMDPRAGGYDIRRWLRGLSEGNNFKLLLTSTERLDILFRHDDPTRDSPFETLDRVPVVLPLLTPSACEKLVRARLAGHPVPPAAFADIFQHPHHPQDLLDRCAARYDDLTRRQP